MHGSWPSPRAAGGRRCLLTAISRMLPLTLRCDVVCVRVCVCVRVQYLTETTTMIDMYRKLALDAGGWSKLTYGVNTSGGWAGGLGCWNHWPPCPPAGRVPSPTVPGLHSRPASALPAEGRRGPQPPWAYDIYRGLRALGVGELPAAAASSCQLASVPTSAAQNKQLSTPPAPVMSPRSVSAAAPLLLLLTRSLPPARRWCLHLEP